MAEIATFFDEIAEAQTPAPVKRKLDAATKRAMAKRDAERTLLEDQELGAAYRRLKRAERDAICEGAYGRDVRGLITFMKTMTLESAPALLRMVERSVFWRGMTVAERFTLLGILNAGIAACRERSDLPPYDDPLPWCEAPKAYQRLKTMMGLDGR